MMTQSLNSTTVLDYAHSIEEVARSLQMDLKQGLTTAEIDERLQSMG
ncbi:cation-transporting P-type ATPase [Leptothermofonsia sp. ETS-13]